jgi:predicted GNAT family N-acyltransferase
MDLSFATIDFASPEYDQSLALRYRVLREPLGLDYSAEQISEEWAHRHFAAFLSSGELVGYLMLEILSGGKAKMRQVAVLPELQSMGIGSGLVQFSEQWSRDHGISGIKLHARKEAVPFYLKLGYHAVGEEFLEVGIPHFAMQKDLLRSES